MLKYLTLIPQSREDNVYLTCYYGIADLNILTSNRPTTMTRCKYCNVENQPDDIFCVNCGKELNKTIKKTPSPKVFSPSKIFCRIVILFILSVVAYVIYAVVYPSVRPGKLPVISQTVLVKAEKKLRALEFRKSKNIIFSTEEITVLYNKYLINDSFKKKPLFITVSNNDLCFTILVQFYNMVHLLTPVTITGNPVFEFINNKRIFKGLHIKKISIGEFSVPKPFYKHLTPYFTGYYNNRSVKILKRIFDIKIDKNKDIMFILHSKKQYPYIRNQ